MRSQIISVNSLISFFLVIVCICFTLDNNSILGVNGESSETDKLPAFTLVDIFHVPPESRQKCTTILGWLMTKYPNNYVLLGIRNIIYQLSLPKSKFQENSEKELIAALDSLQGTMSNISGLEPGTYISILTCSVDNKGRTILQKMVEHGLLQALSHTLSQKFWVGAKLNKLIDTEGNNLAHLAAMSENDEIVHYVLGIMFKSNIVAEMLDSLNNHGQRPIDIAIHHRDQQTVDTMKNFFRVSTLAEREGFVDGVEVIEDSILSAEKEESEKQLKELMKQEEYAKKIDNDIEYYKEIKNNENEQGYDQAAENDQLDLDYSRKEAYVNAQQIPPQTQQYDASQTLDSQIQTLEDEYSPTIRELTETEYQELQEDDKLKSDYETGSNNQDHEYIENRTKFSEINKIDTTAPALRGYNENDDDENDKVEKSKNRHQSENRWTATGKAIVGASILVGTSILAATVVFIVCKGYSKAENIN
ncbi:transmembrane protein [Cryptosporidium xiaoi]|uniref:Transmembrane protein n=1 Tax=Cryptosporidium xiaoi TaxID=659607 RepID=A0AAV9XZZ7_9CRYT